MGRNKTSKSFYNSLNMNKQTYLQYYTRLKELCISMFEWKGLPDNIDTRYLELTLFEKGSAVYFNDDVLGNLALPVTTSGRFDVYGIPTRRNAYAVNGYNKTLYKDNSIIIYNNMVRTNSEIDVQMYAQRLADLDRTIDVNTKAQKTPIVILCDENQRLTMLNLYKQYDGNEPFIFAGKNLDMKGISVLSTGAPYISDKIYELKTQIWNEALTYLGISNINIVKKERMITDEVQRNQGGVIASRRSRLEARQQACNEINKMFGLNVEVNYKEDYPILENSEDVNYE